MGGLFGRPSVPQTNATAIGSMSVQTSAYGSPIPWVFGTARVSPNLLQYEDFTAIPHTSSQSAGGKGGGGDVTTTNYSYTAAVILGLTHGPIAGISKAWKDKDLTSLAELRLDLYSGTATQGAHPYMQTKHPDRALTYRGISYVAAGAYDLGQGATLGNHSFEVQTATTIPGRQDAKISDVIRAILTDKEQGLGLSDANLGDLTQFDNFCLANGIWVSPVYKEQKPAYEAIKRLLQIGFADCVRSNGVLKIMPYSDAAAGSALAEYNPTIAPCADLTDDDFLTSDSPVKITRKSLTETFNHVKVKFSDRSNDYNDSVAEAKDQADIEAFGLRTMSDVELKEICDPAVAQKVADFILQRSLSIRNEYEYQLPWKYCWLEPMDVVNLWYPRKGLAGQPVLITEIAEDEDGTLTVKAEDYPLGANRATLVPPTTTSGYTPDFAVDPGNATAPAIIEAPLALANGEPQLWLATAGGANWGGADVWVSTDNASYQKVGRHTTKSRYGTLTAPLPSGAALDSLSTLSVDLSASGGVLQGGTQQNALDLLTRSMVGGEFFAFANANLTGLNKYSLQYLVRGAYGSDIVDHAAGEAFVRLDDGLFAYSYPKEWMGKTIWIKLVSLNVYGGGIQDLSEVPAYTYKIQGAPIGVVQNLRITSAWSAGADVKVGWDVVQDADSYDVEIWAGSTPTKVRSINVTNNAISYQPQDQRADGGPWRSVTIKVRSRALTGRTGRWAIVSAMNPQIGPLTSIKIDPGMKSGFFKATPPAEDDFAGLIIWISADQTCPAIDSNKLYEGRDTFVTISTLADGAPLVGGTSYYVRAAAYDTFGKDSLSVSAAVGFVAAGVLPDAKSISESQLTNALAARVALVDGPSTLAGSVAQQISNEVAARVGADAANANSIAAEINARQSGDAVNANSIIAEANSRASADTLITQRVDSLTATVGGNTAAITAEQTARASADVALGVRIDSVKSVSDANTAAISNEQATRSAADSALASQINTVSANFAASGGENMYAGVDPLSVVPGTYGVYGTVIKNGTVNPYQLAPGETLTLSADLWLDAAAAAGGDTGVLYVWAQQSSGTWTVAAYISVTSQAVVRKSVSLTLPGAAADMVQVSVSLYHTSKSGSSTAQAGTAYAGRIQVERGSVATAYKAGAQMLNAAVQTESTARANADNALSQQIATVTASVGNNAAAITSEQVARASADAALGLRIDSLTTTVGNTTAQITSEAGTRASADSALSSRIDTVTASTASNAAQIASEATARANGDSANATQILNLQATVGALRSDANLLPNAGFTANNGNLPDGWQLYSNDAAPISATIVPGVNGYKAVRVSWSGQNTTTKGIYLYPFFEGGFRKNTSYIFAVRARAVSLPVGATMLLSPSNYPWASFSMISNPPMTTDWQWYIGIGVRVNDTPGEYFISVSNGAGGQSNQIDICTPIIHEGSIFAGFNLGNDYQVAVNAAAIKAEQTARVTADSALSVRIDSLTAVSNSNSAAITAEQVARATADSALSGRIDSVVASSSANAASILTEQSTRAAADSALSQQISLVTARYSAGALNRDPLISNIANWALWTGVTPSVVAGSVAGRNAYHATSAGWMYDITPIPVNPARSYRISGRIRRSADCNKVCYIGVLLFDSAGNNISADGAWWYYPVAGVQPGVSWTDYGVLFGAGQSRQIPANAAYMSAGVILMYGAGADSGWMEAEMLRIDDSTAESAIQTEQVARAAADSALSSQITTVQTTVNGNTASIQQQATSINGLSAQYTIKTDVNGNIAGIGLASTSVNGQPISDVTILSDRFALVQPGVERRVPFVVTSKNGVAQIGLDGAVVVNGSLTGDALAFNSITGDKAQVGTFSANIFSSGIAGNNLLENAAFAATYVAGGVVKADAYSDSVNGGVSAGEITVGVNLIGDDYHPAGINGLVIRQLGTSGQGQADPFVEVVSPIVPAAAGQWIEASFYSGAFRCISYGYLGFYDASGNALGYQRFSENAVGSAGRSLASFYRHALIAQAPAGTVCCRILFRKRPTLPGHSDSYMMIQCPMVAAAMSGNQTTPSPWSPPGLGTQINGGIIKTGTIMTQHLAAGSISADKLASRELSSMFATIGTMRTATSGARTEISDNVIKVFDPNGTLRVKIGNLLL